MLIGSLATMSCHPLCLRQVSRVMSSLSIFVGGPQGLMNHPLGMVQGDGNVALQPSAAGLWGAWNWEPIILLVLLGSAVLYSSGVRHLWASAGVGRGLAFWQPAAFAGGWLALFVALVSPLDALSALLFSVHMVQHE